MALVEAFVEILKAKFRPWVRAALSYSASDSPLNPEPPTGVGSGFTGFQPRVLNCELFRVAGV